MQKTQFLAGPGPVRPHFGPILGLGIRKCVYLPQKMGPAPFRPHFSQILKMGPALFASLMPACKDALLFKPRKSQHKIERHKNERIYIRYQIACI